MLNEQQVDLIYQKRLLEKKIDKIRNCDQNFDIYIASNLFVDYKFETSNNNSYDFLLNGEFAEHKSCSVIKRKKFSTFLRKWTKVIEFDKCDDENEKRKEEILNIKHLLISLRPNKQTFPILLLLDLENNLTFKDLIKAKIVDLVECKKNGNVYRDSVFFSLSEILFITKENIKHGGKVSLADELASSSVNFKSVKINKDVEVGYGLFYNEDVVKYLESVLISA